MNDHQNMWLATAIITLIVGILIIAFGSGDPTKGVTASACGIILVVIAAMAWNEVHYLHLQELIKEKRG